jgi:hypothetical protein
VRRWALGAVALFIVLGVGSIAVLRALGFSGGRASSLVSVVSQWLAAYVLWSFAGGLALRYGVLEVYEPGLHALLAVGVALFQYRLQVRGGLERGRLVFVSGQLLWLVIVLAQNGTLWESPGNLLR